MQEGDLNDVHSSLNPEVSHPKIGVIDRGCSGTLAESDMQYLKRMEKMKIAYRKHFDDPTSNSKERIYQKDVDTSRVSRFFYETAEGRGLRFYPRNDSELLKFMKKKCFDKSTQLEIYHVIVDDKVTVEKCLELLNGIDCESRFIACSVEESSLFFAELNKDDASRLEASGGISCIYPRGDLLFQH